MSIIDIIHKDVEKNKQGCEQISTYYSQFVDICFNNITYTHVKTQL